ncbi:pyridoxamine 5'-phosphate oxidase family protein [Chondromyces apiculatus]|uniref:Flavodoxin reductases (Ferredoxin-NADPH reductases) family 1 n=1 Tax=Chondromyces apiculatus DSM 436 TaxID=1192034 RepID=A0A017TFV4_9BACT|nr:pyridoxamine 5'-phosphate oxidase family protein [Chondromyces apiculatus]EYF08168.1 Flavodoxin reductases (ferredoxin-NADPH reductases) family 1 [Chondromyces apiculatus DSM 436]
MGRFSEIAFTPAVKAAQERMGSRRAYARLDGGGGTPDTLGEDEAQFLAERDSFYMASIGASGWPYIQHRGGPKGFVHVLDAHTLAFADFRGNRQYISVGNVTEEDRVALIFVDYPHRARLKVLARAKTLTRAEAPDLFARVAGEAPAERVFVLRVEGFDWNCPQHITPRFTEDEVRAMSRPMLAKLEALERENAALRARLGAALDEETPAPGATPRSRG